MQQLDADPMNEARFRFRIKKLMTKALGSVLKRDSFRAELYVYNENMLRGYVRMQAEANGVELFGEEVEARDKQYMHVPARANTGYKGPTVPAGVALGPKKSGATKIVSGCSSVPRAARTRPRVSLIVSAQRKRSGFAAAEFEILVGEVNRPEHARDLGKHRGGASIQ